MLQILHKCTLAIILAGALCGNADVSVNLNDFKQPPKTADAYDENFNSGIGRWKLISAFELRPNEGMTGSNALFYQVLPGQKNIGKAELPIKIIPGAIYNVSIKYRVEDVMAVRSDSRRPIFILGYIQTYDKSGNKLKSQNFWAGSNFKSGWQSFTSSVTIPPDAMENAQLIIVLDWWHTGKIWFDDITVEPADIVASIFPLEPSNLALSQDGVVALRAYFHHANTDRQNLAMLVNLNGSSKLLYPQDGVYRGKFGSFSGAVKVNAKLVNLKEKNILAEHNYQLFRQPNTPVDGATAIDRFGRATCDGKPVLPIGIFTYQQMQDEDLTRVSDCGFDFIMFGCRAKNLSGKNSNTKKEMTSMLDGLAKYNLKAMLQLTLMIPHKEHIQRKFEPEFEGLTERKQLLSALINAVRKHPSFLGYYLADENQRNELKEVQELRQTVSGIDPWHLTVTLTDRSDNFPFFIPTGDILCHDSYPTKPEDVILADKDLEKLAQMKTPIWFCAQSFLWRVLNKETMKAPDPSEGAIRAVPLLAVIYGVKGFMFYSYHEIFAKGSKFDPQHPTKFWPQVVSTIKMLREMEPFILSITKAPQIEVKPLSGHIRAQAMVKDDGYIAIPLVSIVPGKNSARIILPAGKKYVSRYGLSTEQPDGSWVFSANGIDCDIIYSK